MSDTHDTVKKIIIKNNKKALTVQVKCINVYDRGTSLDSELTKSSGVVVLQANPRLDLEPLMHWVCI